MISVIIPSYRPQHYTLECLESLKNQTLSTDEFEVIVVLNGEREPYFSMLQQAMPTNGRLLYSPKASACSSRNMGIDNAKGEYICFIDDDDKVSHDYLKELSRHATRDVIAASNCMSLYNNGQCDANTYTEEYKSHAGQGLMPFHRPKRIFSVPWMKLIHRDIIGERRFNDQFHSGQDALLMFEISDRMSKVCFTSESALYYWRQRSDSLHQLSRMKALKKYSRLAWAYTKIYLRHPHDYNFFFYFTRLLASVHGIITGK